VKYDGVVLAGGEGRRLGGVDKPSIEIGARRLLDIALDALARAETTIVVAAPSATVRPVIWAREDPVGSGPAAALAAALPMVTAERVVLLAADLPFVTASAVEQLVAAASDGVAAVAIDSTGRDQPLLACYRTASIGQAMPSVPVGTSMRALLAGLETVGTIRRLDLGGEPPICSDCDTPVDLRRARELI